MSPTITLLANGLLAGAAASVVFALLGLALAGVGFKVLRTDRAVGRWPRAPGTVVSSTYGSHESTTRVDGWDRSTTMFKPIITYRYTVAGAAYTGKRFNRADLSMGPDKVKRIIDRYPAGAKIEVMHDPNDPSLAYLETSTSGGAIFFLAMGSFFALMGLGGLALMYFTA